MAFKRTSASASKKTTVKKAATPRRGVGNYNILNFGTSSLYDFTKSQSKYDFRIAINLSDNGGYDESGENYDRIKTAELVVAGLTCTKSGKRRGTNHYFFTNENSESDSDPGYTGSSRFDIKLNAEDDAAVSRATARIHASLVEFVQNKDVFEDEFFVNFASVYLDQARASDSYEYKSRVLFYTKEYEANGIEFDVDSLAALAFASLTMNGWYGAIFSNKNGYGGSLSAKVDVTLYEHICSLCDTLGLDTTPTTDNVESDVEPHAYSLDSEEEDEEDEDFF